MNLRDLHYLVALAEHRHFGRAAEASFVSQPTLSTQIKKLEDELGVALVERTPRKVLLTETGREIARRARGVLSEIEEIKAIAQRTRDPESGTLRLGIFPTLGPYLLPHLVPQVRKQFPRLELLLVEEKTEQVIRLLREGSLDVGILALPLHEESLHTEFLFEEPFVLAVPENHPLAHKQKRLKLDDLEDESLLLLEDGHCMRDQALEVCSLPAQASARAFAPPAWKRCARWWPRTWALRSCRHSPSSRRWPVRTTCTCWNSPAIRPAAASPWPGARARRWGRSCSVLRR